MKHLHISLLQMFSAEAGSGESSAAAGQEGESAPDTVSPETPKMTWEEVKAQPEFQKKMQETVRNRLKNAKDAEADLVRLAPALQILSRHYGISGDMEALAKAVAADARFMEEGHREDMALHDHYRGLQAQSALLRQAIPDFDLDRELENPVFVRLTAPGMGVSLEDAYYTLHRREVEDSALQEKTRQISNAIRSGSLRPEENGTLSHVPAVTTFDYRSASRDQRESLKRQIRLAAARGEKIYPGMMG